ncbi:MAG TPA: hypothetical protein DDX40_06655 [Rikenellaceae bacterium]|nr:hypothetical protein [Rikenellaceae bacterium]
MVRILTKDYTELDLTKGFEFQIEMENPMLEEDHIPSAFSTQISFPPSPVNRKVFGYTPAMFLAPNVKRLEASVWIGGVPFVSGTLVYDGIEDGYLMYTFTEKVVELEGKIWNQELLPFNATSLPTNNAIFRTPLLINKQHVADHPYSEEDVSEACRLKYYNYQDSKTNLEYESFIPAIFVSAIIKNSPIDYPSDILGSKAEDYPLAILGTYHEILFDNLHKGDGGKPTTSDTSTDIARFLPDITLSELLANIGKIFCSAFFRENNRLVMKPIQSILESSAIDLDDKISDDFSSEIEPASKYKFGYQEDDSGNYNMENLEKDLANGEVTSFADLFISSILDKFNENYTVIFVENTGDLYSGRRYTAKIGSHVEKYYEEVTEGESTELVEKERVVDDYGTFYDSDVIYQGSKTKEFSIKEEDADDFDCISDFSAVRCTPERTLEGSYFAPIIEQESSSSDRSKRTYVGIIHNDGCLVSNGCFGALTRMDAMFQGKGSITPDALWDKYHKAFAEWLGKTRQRVSVDVNLSPIDLHNFRLYRPVYFKGRKWIVAKLSVTVAAGSEAVSTRGEFIEI